MSGMTGVGPGRRTARWSTLYVASALVFVMLSTLFVAEVIEDDPVGAGSTGVAGPASAVESASDSAEVGVAGVDVTQVAPVPGEPGDAAPVSVAPVVNAGEDRAGVGEGVLKVGAIVPLSYGAYGDPITKTTNAFLRELNAQGGINGLQVKFLAYDDGFIDNNKGKAAARRLVEEDKVFAFVGGFTPVSGAVTYPYLESKGVPWIGNGTFTRIEQSSPISFPTVISPIDMGRTGVKYAYHQLGCKRQAFAYADVESGQESLAEARRVWEMLGVEPTAVEPMGADAAADLTPIVLRMRASDPDCVVHSADVTLGIKLHQAMQRQDWKVPTVGVSAGSADEAVAREVDHAWLDGAVNVRVVETVDIGTPGMNEFVATMQKYYGDEWVDLAGPWGINNWLAWKVFVEAARQIPVAELSRSRLIEQLEQVRDLRTGLVPPISYFPGNHGHASSNIFVRFDAATATWKRHTSWWDSGLNDRTESPEVRA